MLSADPVTAAGERAGWLGVHVACNDIAAMGAAPVGVLATVLLPESADEALVTALMEDMHRAADGLQALKSWVDTRRSHPGIAATILAMTAVGKAPRDRIVRSSGARAGDAIVLTKWAGLEGTAILSNDCADDLTGRVAPALIAAGARCIDFVSVVREGLAAAELGATAMHDPTEGGVLGAIWEMAEASGLGFELDVDNVPIRDETKAICEVFGADPLKLISSGALLIACADGPAMVKGLHAQSLTATVIGRMLGAERVILRDGRREPAQPVWRDELWRVLEERSR